MNKKISFFHTSDWFLFIFAAISTGLFSIYLKQDLNWDLQHYHFYNGYAFINHRLNIDFSPTDTQSYINPFLDAINYLLIIHLPPKLTGFLIGAVQGINVWVLYLIAGQFINTHRRLTKQVLAIVIAFLGICSANAIGEVGTTFNDLILSNLILLSVLFIVLMLQGKNFFSSKIDLFIAGLLAGAAVGLKLTFAIYIPGIFIAFLLIKDLPLPKLQIYLFLMLGVCSGFVITDGYWIFLIWQKFHNPVFPLYNKIFKSAQFSLINDLDDRFKPTTLIRHLFYPFYFSWNQQTAETDFRDFRLPVAYFLITLLFFMVFIKSKRINNASIKWLIIFFISSYIVWQVEFSIQRYIIVLELLAPLLIYVLLEMIISSKLIRVFSLLITFAFLATTLKPMNWGRSDWTPDFFGVRMPEEVKINHQKDNALLILNMPVGFLLPYFPNNWRFISITNNNFTNIKSFMENLSKSNSYHFYGLVRVDSTFNIEKINHLLNSYHFKPLDSCIAIPSKFNNIRLCKLSKI